MGTDKPTFKPHTARVRLYTRGGVYVTTAHVPPGDQPAAVHWGNRLFIPDPDGYYRERPGMVATTSALHEPGVGPVPAAPSCELHTGKATNYVEVCYTLSPNGPGPGALPDNAPTEMQEVAWYSLHVACVRPGRPGPDQLRRLERENAALFLETEVIDGAEQDDVHLALMEAARRIRTGDHMIGREGGPPAQPEVHDSSGGLPTDDDDVCGQSPDGTNCGDPQEGM